ncbi:MAG: DUF4249 domain-containing protein [Bernardetiaceae bacterium]
MRIYFVWILMIGTLLTACEQVIDLPLRSMEEPLVVIQGQVVDTVGYSWVILTQSLDFYNPTQAPRISGAQVSISDDTGNEMIFREDSPGFYVPTDPAFKGEVGRTYSLSVQVQEEFFRASSQLLPVTQIDSLTVRYVAGRPFRDDGYYLYFFAKEPPNEKNFYRWRVYLNDSLFDGFDDILLADDRFVQDNIENLELPYAFDLGDTVALEQYSINEDVFDYYSDLLSLAGNDGGLFSPPPVNPRTNISNGGLGIFSASSLIRVVQIIEDE